MQQEAFRPGYTRGNDGLTTKKIRVSHYKREEPPSSATIKIPARVERERLTNNNQSTTALVADNVLSSSNVLSYNQDFSFAMNYGRSNGSVANPVGGNTANPSGGSVVHNPSGGNQNGGNAFSQGSVLIQDSVGLNWRQITVFFFFTSARAQRGCGNEE